jgi:predicted amidophosphoribosyltransferase
MNCIDCGEPLTLENKICPNCLRDLTKPRGALRDPALNPLWVILCVAYIGAWLHVAWPNLYSYILSFVL